MMIPGKSKSLTDTERSPVQGDSHNGMAVEHKEVLIIDLVGYAPRLQPNCAWSVAVQRHLPHLSTKEIREITKPVDEGLPTRYTC